MTCRNRFLQRIYVAIFRHYMDENGSSISWSTEFAGEPCFPHGIKSIFISGSARFGKNCTIFQQVTIGSNTLSDSKGVGAPVIGDNCYIGAGAKIVGNVRVGNGVRVGANAVVFKDVPDNATVIPGEQRIIQRPAPMDNRYYSYHGRWVYFDDGRWVPVEDAAILARLEPLRRG